LVGFIGVPLLVTSVIATLFGFWTQVSTQSALLTIPIGLWEFSLGVYLIVKGFKPSPITAAMAALRTPTDRQVVPV
jgi:Na+/H+ antiporter NhaD/arsenite permease-like protein